MKKYMVVYKITAEESDPINGATFADDYTEAQAKKMDIECGLGGYAELYVREERDGGPEYVLLEV